MPQDVFTNPNSLNITGPVVIAADNIGGAGSLKVASSLLAQDGKFGKAAAGDLMDYSGATALRKLGPTSTKLQDVIAATTNNWTDSNGNQINAGAKSTFSTITATNHNYAGATPSIIVLNQQTGTATATAAGTIGATQYTPTGGVSATYVAEARLI
jgi:hypothetical protein